MEEDELWAGRATVLAQNKAPSNNPAVSPPNLRGAGQANFFCAGVHEFCAGFHAGVQEMERTVCLTILIRCIATV